MGWMRRLIGRATDPSQEHDRPAQDVPPQAIDEYFRLSSAIETAKRDGDLAGAIRAARQTYTILPRVVREWVREYGTFDISTSHAVDTAAPLMAVVGDRDALRELRGTLDRIPEMRDWMPVVDQADRDAESIVAVLTAVERNPGLLQNRLKEHVAAEDARRLSALVRRLEKGSRLRRVRTGKTYRLSLAVESSRVASAEPTPVGETLVPAKISPGSRRGARSPRTLDLSKLPYVRLPMSPSRMDEQERCGDSKAKTSAKEKPPLFEVDGVDWTLASADRLPPAERPAAHYKDVYPTAGYTYWLDPKGHRDGFENAAAVLRVTDRTGSQVAERGLPHDAYRVDVNPSGSGIFLLSRDGVLHGYSETLDPLISESVANLPEFSACAKRLGIAEHETKNHVRCVAIGSELDRYLYTVVDEAWCMGRDGRVLWGLKLPSQEGWTRVATRSDRAGTSDEVLKGLSVMGLELPISPAEITRCYRKLALEWHPDRNLGDRDATRRMQELNVANDLLTGMDLSTLSVTEVEHVTYERELGHHVVRAGGVEVELRASLHISEKAAADWIYAADFGRVANRAYLAGYSGKVVEVSRQGEPLRVYDIGAVPRLITDGGEFTYILTDTRLYVLSGDRLYALVDVFDKGDLMICDLGFALCEAKQWTWYSPEGLQLGQVRTRDPIRRIGRSAKGLVIETRRDRAVVSGAPPWWQ